MAALRSERALPFSRPNDDPSQLPTPRPLRSLAVGAQEWEIGDLLVLEPDRRSASLIAATMQSIAQRIRAVTSIAAAEEILAHSSVDLVTTTLDLPDGHGAEILHRILSISGAPVIIVTAPGPDISMADGLDAGADDYVLKPVRPAEMRARVRAVMRRGKKRSTSHNRYIDDRISIDFLRSEVITAEGVSKLSATEQHVLRELVQVAGTVLTHDEILSRVWGPRYDREAPNLHVFMDELRRKLGDDPAAPAYIRTHLGIGYEFHPRSTDDF